MTDCEGYEATLLPGIDWQQFRPTPVLFELHNLGGHKVLDNDILIDNGYVVYRLGGDSFAMKGEFMADWRRRSKRSRCDSTDPAVPGATAGLMPTLLAQKKL